MEGAFFAPKAKGRVLTMTYDTSPASPQRIELSGRESLTVSGVEDVDRFDETEIVMNTSLGVLVVTGDSLHIGKLSLDGGELHVDGASTPSPLRMRRQAAAACSRACSGVEAPWACRSPSRRGAFSPRSCSASSFLSSMTCCAPCGCSGRRSGALRARSISSTARRSRC